MIWLTWRQFRLQALTAVVAFLALGAVLGYTGPHVVHLYHASGIQACQATHGDCGPLIDNFTSHFVWWHGLGAFLIVIPALIGVFWGAPLLARELETGTHRLAWTQSVTRTRWLATKVIIIGVASIITAAAFSVIIALWLSPFDKVTGNRFSPGTFSQRGIVPIAYAVFAFALGVAAGGADSTPSAGHGRHARRIRRSSPRRPAMGAAPPGDTAARHVRDLRPVGCHRPRRLGRVVTHRGQGRTHRHD